MSLADVTSAILGMRQVTLKSRPNIPKSTAAIREERVKRIMDYLEEHGETSGPDIERECSLPADTVLNLFNKQFLPELSRRKLGGHSNGKYVEGYHYSIKED